MRKKVTTTPPAGHKTFFSLQNCDKITIYVKPNGVVSPLWCELPLLLSQLEGRVIWVFCCPLTSAGCAHTGESLTQTRLCPEAWPSLFLQTKKQKKATANNDSKWKQLERASERFIIIQQKSSCEWNCLSKMYLLWFFWPCLSQVHPQQLWFLDESLKVEVKDNNIQKQFSYMEPVQIPFMPSKASFGLSHRKDNKLKKTLWWCLSL